MPYKHYTDMEMVNLRATIMLTYGRVDFSFGNFSIFLALQIIRLSIEVMNCSIE